MTPRGFILVLAALAIVLLPPPRAAAETAAEIKQRIERRYNIDLATDSPPRQHMRWTLLQNSDRDALHRYLQILDQELSKHQLTFVANSGLKKIIFFKEFVTFGDTVAGSYARGVGELYFAVSSLDREEELYIRALIHHEFYHLMQETAAEWHGSSPKWLLYNIQGWHYGQGGRVANRANRHLRLDLGKVDRSVPGFFNLYSRTSMSEDQAEVFAALFIPAHKTVLQELASQDELLARKVKHMQRFIEYYSVDRRSPLIQPLPDDDPQYLWHYLRGIASFVLSDEERAWNGWVKAPTYRRFINEKAFDDWRPLHYAAAYGRVQGVRAMLEVGAEVNVADVDGLTPLHLAAAGGHENVVQLLLDSGADPVAEDSLGRTPLDLAIHRQVKTGRLERLLRRRN